MSTKESTLGLTYRVYKMGRNRLLLSCAFHSCHTRAHTDQVVLFPTTSFSYSHFMASNYRLQHDRIADVNDLPWQNGLNKTFAFNPWKLDDEFNFNFDMREMSRETVPTKSTRQLSTTTRPTSSGPKASMHTVNVTDADGDIHMHFCKDKPYTASRYVPPSQPKYHCQTRGRSFPRIGLGSPIQLTHETADLNNTSCFINHQPLNWAPDHVDKNTSPEGIVEPDFQSDAGSNLSSLHEQAEVSSHQVINHYHYHYHYHIYQPSGSVADSESGQCVGLDAAPAASPTTAPLFPDSRPISTPRAILVPLSPQTESPPFVNFYRHDTTTDALRQDKVLSSGQSSPGHRPFSRRRNGLKYPNLSHGGFSEATLNYIRPKNLFSGNSYDFGSNIRTAAPTSSRTFASERKLASESLHRGTSQTTRTSSGGNDVNLPYQRHATGGLSGVVERESTTRPFDPIIRGPSSWRPIILPNEKEWEILTNYNGNSRPPASMAFIINNASSSGSGCHYDSTTY